jgi:SEC-C motif-containing protein
MRSRYSAYVKGEVDHIMRSCVKKDGHDIDEDATRRWSEKSRWLGLKILGTSKGTPTDDEGSVDFIATYEMNGLRDEHHEISRFVKKQGQWLYDSGEFIPSTIVRGSPKIGRNDPCPCGSGKKYKKCCGAGN